ncbi:glycine-rich domain-containing protein 1 isoform X2 [Tanacetum coccineum]
MDMEQESEWSAAQNIMISEDLVTAAKRQLQFLAAVDRNRWLYEEETLKWAIYRYNARWLPLLAKHSESRVTEGPLVVPLDCEWVWHTHRLNPVRYISDCEELYGKVLDNYNVVSSVQGIDKRETEEIWNKLYPNESYEFDTSRAASNEFSDIVYGTRSFSKYDFVLAVERQKGFFYQVSRPHVKSDVFLEAAFARYKGFLHLIRRNREKSLKRFCVPTYDIDLIWHTHQLHPASYCKDLTKLIGNVLEHDDTDQNRGKGQKLDTGFSETIQQWEETFGSRYQRAGVMYRGTAPYPCNYHSLHTTVMLEFVEIKNLPQVYKGKVSVVFSMAQPDGIFNVKGKRTIQSESGQKQFATFECQPTGYLVFELVSQETKADTLGSCYISLEDFFGPVCKLSVEKWLDLVPSSGIVSSEPISLRVAVSCTLPAPIPLVVLMLRSSLLSKGFYFLPFHDMVRFIKSWTQIIDASGDVIIKLKTRNIKRKKGAEDKALMKEIVGFTRAGEKLVLAQFRGQEWSLLDSLWSLKLPDSNDKDCDLLLTGPHMVKLLPGRKLDFELKHHDKQTIEHSFMTAVEFSAEHPYGKSVALFNFKLGTLAVPSSPFLS